MKIIWITQILLVQSYLTIGSHIQDEYSQYSFYQKTPLSPRPLDVMADLTNDLGVCVLRILAAGGAIGNVGFSPFGLMAVSVLLYEGSSGYSALQIKQSLNLPWEILAVRIGVRDLNRYLKTYFKSDGFLNGLSMSREEVCLRPQFKRVLRLYGFDDPNGFLIDSCPESAITTTRPLPPMSVTTHGTVVTEIVPTSQIIRVSTNITNGSANDISTVATELPANVTYMGDTTFTISNIDTNTNPPMNSQADMMVVDVETRPNTRPIDSSTSQAETTVLINEQEPKPSNKIRVVDKKPNGWSATETLIASTTPITSDDPMMVATTVTQTSMDAVSSYTSNSLADQLTDTTNDNNESRTSDAETSTTRLRESTTDETTLTDVFDANDETFSPGDSYTLSTRNHVDVTVVGSTESAPKTTTDTNKPNTTNDSYVLVGNMTEAITSTTSEVTTTADTDETRTNSTDNSNTAETLIPYTKFMYDDATVITTTASEANMIPEKSTVQTTASEESELSDNDYVTTTGEDMSTTTDVSSTTVNNLSNTTENEIIKVAESNRHYQIAPLQDKKRSLESNDNLPTFNVEFVVRKEDVLRADCNQTRKRTVIKPDRILTEYPKNSGISIKLRESKKRKRRHLQRYHGFNAHGNQWFDGYKNYYGPPSDWIDRSSDPFEANLFSAGYRRIPFFTYTAVLPFGFVFELKSQVIEIPLDDPKYTLMIIMPNHPIGLSELLVLLPTMSLRTIHNSLKPTAVHATIPTFKYSAKVDLTSALQQVGIQDVFYRYKADLSFMSPDARLFVSSVQQVVSVTAQKYNTPPVFEIQRKYVKHDFVVSKPFVYFVIDVHTKVSLIAGVITDPLESPIWI